MQGNDEDPDKEALTVQVAHLLVDVFHEKHDRGYADLVALIGKGYV